MITVAFEHPVLGSAYAEIETRGPAFCLAILAHCQDVQARRVDYRRLKVFATYKGVDMFQAHRKDDFAIYSVEPDTGDGLTVTIMCAATHGRLWRIGGVDWNGYDYEAFRFGIMLLPRARAWFH